MLAASVMWRLKRSKPPKSFVTCSATSPVGSPPPFGDRFCQNSECSTWPERLKARSFCSLLMAPKSSLSRAVASFSSAVLAPFT